MLFLQRPSRSSISRTKSSSTAAKPLGPDPLAELQQLQAAHMANLRRQSTANTSHLLGTAAAAAAAVAVTASPTALFAAAAAEGAAVAAAAAAVLAQAQVQEQHGGQQQHRRPADSAQRARRLSTASDVGTTEGSSNSWSEAEGEQDSSPEFTLRRTTARTGGSGGARRGAASLPTAQHHHLQPPAAASVGQQMLAAAAVPAAMLPEALPLLRVAPPADTKPAEVRRRLAGLCVL